MTFFMSLAVSYLKSVKHVLHSFIQALPQIFSAQGHPTASSLIPKGPGHHDWPNDNSLVPCGSLVSSGVLTSHPAGKSYPVLQYPISSHCKLSCGFSETEAGTPHQEASSLALSRPQQIHL